MRTLLLALMLWPAALSAQLIVITFEGLINGAPTPLDSILVMNLTQGGDTTIYYPDNVLVLGTTGVGELGLTNALPLRSRPNPFAGTTEVVIDAADGEMLLTLHDGTGREVAAYTAMLPAGEHRFNVGCEMPGVHLLVATQGGVRRSARLVATEGTGKANLSLVGSASRSVNKSDRSLFGWNPGDELRYIGYATSGGIVCSAAIQEVPVVTATRIFNMAAGVVCPGAPTVTDINGNTYATVQIGSQCWMAENLRTTNYANGDPIANVTSSTDWPLQTSGAWVHYNNDGQYEVPFGKLYNCYAVTDPRNVCPAGWHAPSHTEWQQLELALGMPPAELNQSGWIGVSQNVGGKLKSVGTQYWLPPNTGATNSSGFTALPAGRRSMGPDGNFYYLGSYSVWWSTSISGANENYGRGLYYAIEGIAAGSNERWSGLSVRCVKD